MVRRWIGVALVAASLTVGMPAMAQDTGHYPSPVGAARIIPDPVPVGAAPDNCPPPNLIPGPVSPQAAPMGPPECLSLPSDHSSAFQCENPVEECNFYIHGGMQWMARQRLGAGGIAVFDPGPRPSSLIPPELANDLNLLSSNLSIDQILAQLPLNLANIIRNLANSLNIPTTAPLSQLINAINTQPLAKSGLAAPPGAPLAQQFNNLVPRLNPGVQGTIGFIYGDCAVEYTGYYIFQNDRSIFQQKPNLIDTFFFNAPPGFEGNGRGIFRQADRLSTTFGSFLWNNELNVRWWDQAIQGWEVLVGLRYMEEREVLNIFVDHDGLTNPLPGGITDPRLTATYTTQAFNHLLAPQFGAEYTFPVWGGLAFGFYGKAALGANFVDTHVSLIRGDGVLGFDTTRHNTVFGQVYDIGAFAQYSILERLRFRAGYDATWLCGIATAVDQVDFNLGGAPGVSVSPLRANTAQQALINLVQAQLRLGVINTATLQQVQNAPHGRVNFNGSTVYHGPMFELEFLF
jgi:hypothetical protein